MVDTSFSKFLEELAEESFNKEKILYPSGLKLKELYNDFLNNYEEMQQQIIENIFGKNYSFLFSFCNNNFLHKIITTGEGNLKKSISNISDIAEKVRVGFNGDDGFVSGLYTITEQDANKRRKTVKKISSYVTETIFDSLINASIINIQNDQKNEIRNRIKNKVGKYIQEAFESANYRYTKKGSSKAEKIIDDDNEQLQTITLYGQSDGLVLKKSGDFGKILFNQTELLFIIQKALKNLKSEILGSELKTQISVNLTVAKNEILIAFENPETKKTSDTWEKQVSDAFYITVYNALPSEQKNDFSIFWNASGQANFKKLGKDKLNKILSASTESLVSGELGESMVAIFLSTLPSEKQTLVKIFGQTKGKTGDAAVDIGLEQNLQKIGFQVKNFTSISSEISLYSQSNDVMANDITRYITDTDLNTFRNNIKKSVYYNTINKTLEEEEEKRITENLMILQRHVQYYLRYDEAQGKSEEVEGYKNNFYILNFRIIPTSVLFLLLSDIVKQKENEAFIGEQIFFVTEEKQKADRGKILNKNNFYKTYKNTIKNKNLYSLEENIPKEAVYINFTGIKIQFKEQLKAFL